MNYRHMILLSLLSIFLLASCRAENTLAKTKSMGNSEREIRATIQNYFDGRRNADLNLLQKAFSKDARLMTTGPDDHLIIISSDDYFSIVSQSGKVNVDTAIENLHFDNQLAYAKVVFNYKDKSFTDFLLLIRSNIGWRIVNKSFKLNLD